MLGVNSDNSTSHVFSASIVTFFVCLTLIAILGGKRWYSHGTDEEAEAQGG